MNYASLTHGKHAALEAFFPNGRIGSLNKTGPKGHVCVWNANIFTRESGKIWYGDLDLTKDAKTLMQLARDFGETLYVLKERDGRFERESNPAWNSAVAKVTPEGVILS